MVFTEAAAHSLPLIGMASCEAARELIALEFGALAQEDNPAALADTLRSLMEAEPKKRIEMGQAAQHVLGDRYKEESIYNEWEQLIQQTAKHKNHTCLDQLLEQRWTPALLGEAAIEITSREQPLDTPNQGAETEATIIARLQSEKTALERSYRQLKNKYEALIRQTQGAQKRRR